MHMLFDRHSAVRRDDSAAVFTTEGHLILPLPRFGQTSAAAALRRERGSLERGVCRAYAPNANGAAATHWSELALGVENRIDAEYGRHLVGRELDAKQAIADGRWSIYGWCGATQAEVRCLTRRLGSRCRTTRARRQLPIHRCRRSRLSSRRRAWKRTPRLAGSSSIGRRTASSFARSKGSASRCRASRSGLTTRNIGLLKVHRMVLRAH